MRFLRRCGVVFVSLICASFFSVHAAEIVSSDICVFGGTSGGVAAAVQAAKAGQKVVLTEFGNHLGGMTSGGLGKTDIGNKGAIGGIAREFYRRVGQHYGSNEVWTFEPHVAEAVFNEMAKEAGVHVYFNARLGSVKMKNSRVTEIRMEDGRIFRAKMFIDASYEGDLMARAGVSYFVGREANSTYGETLNGIRAVTPKHQFLVAVNPWQRLNDPASGVLPWIQEESPGTPGSGDKSIQAYNFRLCLTQNPTNRMPIDSPPNYNSSQFDLLARYITDLVASGKTPSLRQFMNIDMVPNGKTDINNNGGFSTDFIGGNYGYPEGSYSERAKIWKAHEDYTRGFLYFLANDPRSTPGIRAEMSPWGLCKDEFSDTGGWPSQLYVREARRMVSDYVMTERNCRESLALPDAVGLAAYTMDSHNCRRIIRAGHVENEGDVQVGGFPPYQISYRSLVPRQTECQNLIVPVCLSASHIAYGSIRMEPVFMVLGQSAAMAATLAIEEKVSVQKIDYEELRRRMLAAGQILSWPAKN
ncbi:MAG TPA: FAD-dependent oxidoreductase [Verrucomicrobiae bacterium]|jgi:hypothetical protein